MGKPQIAVRIPPPLLAELNQYVERVGTSKTDVIIFRENRSPLVDRVGGTVVKGS
ncbi:MAG: hypothetical protein ACKPH1_17455 [Microcystis panniformis]